MSAIKSAEVPGVDLVFAQYLERLGRLRATPHTFLNVRRTITLLREANLSLSTAEEWELEEWLSGLPHSVRTKQLHLDNLRAASRYAVRRGTLGRDNTEFIRLAQAPDKEPRILSTTTLRELKSRCITDQQTAMFHLLAYTGMRLSEVSALTWEDVEPERIRVKSGKGGKLRNVPVHPALGELLTSLPRRSGTVLYSRRVGGPYPSTMHYRLKKLSTGLDVQTHDFRRTVASSLYRNGVPTDTIDRILGWAPREVRSRYYVNIAATQLQEAILRLYADDPV